MKLRSQLLMVGALAFLLPVVAYHSVQQMDIAWRDVRQFDLLQSAQSSAALLTHSGVLDQGLDSSASDLKMHLDNRDIYAEKVSLSMVVDGYADNWVHMKYPPRNFSSHENPDAINSLSSPSPASFELRAAATDTRLHFFLKVTDDDVVYHDPGVSRLASTYGTQYEKRDVKPIATGDHLRLYIENEYGQLKESVIRAVAPGPVQGFEYDSSDDDLRSVVRLPSIRAFWTLSKEGYQLEFSLPLPASGSRFGLVLVDVDIYGESRREDWIGTIDPDNLSEVGVLVYPSVKTEALLGGVVPAGSRVRVFNSDGSLHADVNRLYEKPVSPAVLDPVNSNFFNALLFRFFEWVITTRHRPLSTGYPMKHRFLLDLEDSYFTSNASDRAESEVAPGSHGIRSYQTVDNDRVSGVLLALADESANKAAEAGAGRMHLLFETNEVTTNAFTSSAMVRLFSMLTLVSLLVAGSLFGYASWLSWRMRRLSRQAQSAVGGDGRILNVFKGSEAGDEIGEMSRSFATLVERSSGYTHYLESLASKLSHELRTPLSVVRTSLENIEQEKIDDMSRLMVSRAQGGADQLSVLIRSMSEATRLEHTVQRAEFIDFDVHSWLTLAMGAYKDVYPDHRFKLAFNTGSNQLKPGDTVRAVPELLQQALDKLVGNAADFATAGTDIIVIGSNQGEFLNICVQNSGAVIEGPKLEQIFEPMFSQRSVPTEDAHLGIGLYIVKLVSEAHGGRAYAQNMRDDAGVRIGFVIRSSQIR